MEAPSHRPTRGHEMSRRRLLAAGVAAGTGIGVGAASVPGPRAAAAPTPWPQPDWGTFEGATVIGHSVEGRPIHVVRRTGAAPTVAVLVVGTIHGHEPLATAMATQFLAPGFVLPDWLDLHAIPMANPDGFARRRRRNAANIDLNRDARVLWRRKPRDGGPAGPVPESQPETQAVLGYARSMPTPALSVWIHQYLGWVAPVKGNGKVPPIAAAAAKAYRRPARLPNRPTGSTGQSGGWETTAAYEIGPAILVEGLGGRWPTPLALSRHLAGFVAAIESLPH